MILLQLPSAPDADEDSYPHMLALLQAQYY